VNTLQALGAIGPKAEAAVPAIAAVLRGRANSSQRVPAVIALGKIGHQARSALPSLIAVIEDPEVRGYAVEAIAEIGLEGDAAAVPKKAMAVIESLLETPPTIPPDVTRDHNPSPPESIWAACLLAQLAPELRPAFLDRLTEGLDGPHPWLQQHSARALGCLGPAARAALPRLEKAALEDEDAEVRSASAASLRRIGSPDPAPFLKALASDDETRRKRALEALAELGPTAAEAVPALISALDDDDGNLRAAAARALGCVGPEARAGIPALEVGLGDRFRSFRERCREALEKIRSP
jgi:HEAT repeat protein